MSEKIMLKITGMKCAGCVSAVEQALSAIAGVQAVDVSLEQTCATVTADAKVSDLIAAVESAGFKAES